MRQIDFEQPPTLTRTKAPQNTRRAGLRLRVSRRTSVLRSYGSSFHSVGLGIFFKLLFAVFRAKRVCFSIICMRDASTRLHAAHRIAQRFLRRVPFYFFEE